MSEKTMITNTRGKRNHPRIGGLYRAGLIALLGLGLFLAVREVYQVSAQSDVTPVPLNLPTVTAVATLTNSPTATVGVTSLVLRPQAGMVSAEALDSLTGTNVRQSPSADASTLIVGKILAGHLYRVIGKTKAADWLEILYDKPVPNTPGWVFAQIVQVHGSLDSVPVVDPNGVPTSNPQDVSDQQTAAFLAQTPGGVESATALQASATGVSVIQPTATPELTPTGTLPTFTFPAPFVPATLMPDTSVRQASGSVPPIVPIVGFAALGILGLLLSGTRRS